MNNHMGIDVLFSSTLGTVENTITNAENIPAKKLVK